MVTTIAEWEEACTEVVAAAAAAAVVAEGKEDTPLAADGSGSIGGGRGVGGSGSSTTGQFEYPGEYGDEREEVGYMSAEGGRPTRTHGPGGLKAVNVEKSDRVRAVRWHGRGSKPRSTITTRESSIARRAPVMRAV